MASNLPLFLPNPLMSHRPELDTPMSHDHRSESGPVAVDMGAAAPSGRGGKVLAISDLGFGYVVEDQTDRRYGLSRMVLGEDRFDALAQGDCVVFWPDDANGVAALDKSA